MWIERFRLVLYFFVIKIDISLSADLLKTRYITRERNSHACPTQRRMRSTITRSFAIDFLRALERYDGAISGRVVIEMIADKSK